MNNIQLNCIIYIYIYKPSLLNRGKKNGQKRTIRII